MSYMKRNFVMLFVLLLVLSFGSYSAFRYTNATQAAGIVGTGSPESCTEQALLAAIEGGGSINFFCGTAPAVIVLTKEITVAQNVALDGGGVVTLSGRNVTRVFHVNSGITLDLNKITIAYGAANNPADGGASEGSGGGILNDGGTVNLTDSTIFASRADRNGGGIYNRGGTISLLRTTVAGNTVGDNGGGIVNEKGTMTLANSTISGNYAGDNGGAVFNFSGKVDILHTTIADNNAAFNGSGLLNVQDGTISVRNSIISNNAAAGSPVTGNCGSPIVDGGKNMQFPDASCGDSIPVQDPLLGKLADNGGFALTHALQTGSPAIDTADNAPCEDNPVNKVDERTIARPIGTNCDIGAYEYDPKKPGVGRDGGGNDNPAICVTPIATQPPDRTCPVNTVLNNQGVCVCVRGFVFNRQTNRCERFVPTVTPCPAGQKPNANGQCVAQTCTSQQYLLNADGSCGRKCPSGYLRSNENVCVFVACPPGEVRQQDGSCVPSHAVTANRSIVIQINNPDLDDLSPGFLVHRYKTPYQGFSTSRFLKLTLTLESLSSEVPDKII